MSTCKYCDKPIFWEQSPSAVGSSWVPYDDEDCLIKHTCEHYKPMSQGLREIKAKAAAEREKIFGKGGRP